MDYMKEKNLNRRVYIVGLPKSMNANELQNKKDLVDFMDIYRDKLRSDDTCISLT